MLLLFLVLYELNNKLICKLFKSYFEYGVVTNVKYIYEEVSDFPDISFCDLIPFSTKEGIEYFEMKSNEYLDVVGHIEKNATRQFRDSDSLRIFININVLASNKSFQKKIVNPLENMLLTCVFNGNPCTVSDFIWFYDAYYGSCHKFNTKIPKNSKIYDPGHIGGLDISFLLGDQNSSVLTNGLHIFVTNVIYCNKNQIIEKIIFLF